MRVLLDTHLVLWWLADSERLSPSTRTVISNPANDVLVSAVSALEIAVRSSIGMLDTPGDFDREIEVQGFSELKMNVSHGLEVGRLPLHHRDPFDRVLIAQARIENVPLLTVDSALDAYEYPRLPAVG
ncbi:MAG: type II toxin-antitoxin system VapC family toxin [Pseudoclavibacter sp.]